jgi:hypothetical protein
LERAFAAAGLDSRGDLERLLVEESHAAAFAVDGTSAR